MTDQGEYIPSVLPLRSVVRQPTSMAKDRLGPRHSWQGYDQPRTMMLKFTHELHHSRSEI